MIAFASLFLGLIVGVVPVTVVVVEAVAAVEFELDGESVGRLERKPWTLQVNFGEELEPHELVARAFNRGGEEIARTRQWINLPRAPAEVEFVLERDGEGRATAARLVWQSLLGGPDPTGLAVTFDGRRLNVDSRRRVALPAYDPAVAHVLSAELEFSGNLRSRADVVLGGGSSGEAKSELTAVPVRLPKGAFLPSTEKLQGWFVKKRQALRVAAVEHGPADVLMVRDLGTDEAIRRLGSGARTYVAPGLGGMLPQEEAEVIRTGLRLEKRDRLKIVWPVARPIAFSNVLTEIFDLSRDFTAKEGGLHWLLTRVYYPATGSPPLRFADAVAVAGLKAFGGYSRRAVVLVLGSSPADASRHTPGPVRRYLEKIHVPLSVWSLDPEQSAAAAVWGPAEDISSFSNLRRAVSKLKKDLETQHVVWLEGRHLPREITLSEKAEGIELVR